MYSGAVEFVVFIFFLRGSTVFFNLTDSTTIFFVFAPFSVFAFFSVFPFSVFDPLFFSPFFFSETFFVLGDLARLSYNESINCIIFLNMVAISFANIRNRSVKLGYLI